MEPDTTNSIPGSSPDSSRAPDPPRLGILHLMVLTACVALYVGTVQGLQGVFHSEANQLHLEVITAIHGISAGVALAGLVLFAARRRRGMPFPVHGGEFLIVLLGVTAVAKLFQSVTFVWLSQSGYFAPDHDWTWLVTTTSFGMFAIHVAWWIWAFVRLKTRRWRNFLALIPVCYIWRRALFVLVIQRMGPQASMFFSSQGPLLISVVLGIVVLMDHLKGVRYPWTHWFGVAVYFGTAAAGIFCGIILWIS